MAIKKGRRKFADIIFGTRGSDTIYGLSGDDKLYGLAGNDKIFGDTGNDTIEGGSGDDEVDGGKGNDILSGYTGNDKIYGGAGNDTIDGGRGNDIIRGDAGDDKIAGGDGNDSIEGGSGRDEIDGGRGNDVISGYNDDDKINGGDGNDKIDGGRGNDIIRGGAGNDEIFGGSGNDLIYGGSGNDEIDGGDGKDTIDGGEGDDEIDGGAGDDVIAGSVGNDELNGGAGDDQLSGGAGDDELDGGAGNDVLLGGDGENEINGGEGDDLIIVEKGEDEIAGGAGHDAVVFGGNFEDYEVEKVAGGYEIENLLTGAETFVADDVEILKFKNQTVDLTTDPFSEHTLTLTTGVDKLNGGFEEDTFIDNTGGTKLNDGDRLDGGEEEDELIVSNASGGVTISNPTAHIVNIEELQIISAANVAANISGLTGDAFEEVEISSTATTASSVAVALTTKGNVEKVEVGGLVKVGLADVSTISTVTITDQATTGKLTTVEIEGGVTGVINLVGNAITNVEADDLVNSLIVTAAAGTRTLNLTLEEADLGSGEFVRDATATTVNLTLTGDDNGLEAGGGQQGLQFVSATTVNLATDVGTEADLTWNVTNAKTINFSGNKGVIEIDTALDDGTLAAAGRTADYVFTGGSGSELVRFGTSGGGILGKINLNAGDDEARILRTDAIGSSGLIDGGLGTDKVRASFTIAAGIGNISSKISNFEVLQLDGSSGTNTVDVNNFDGLTNVLVRGATTANTGTQTVTNLAGGSTVTFETLLTTSSTSNDNFGTINLNTATAGQALNLVFKGATTDVGSQLAHGQDQGTINVVNAGSVNILTQSQDATSTDPFSQVLSFAAATNVKLSGNTGWDFGAGTINSVTTLDASGVTATGLVGQVKATAVASNVSFTGGAGDDILTGSGGDDTLVGGAGVDTLSGGGGSDVIRGGLGADNLSGGANADFFVFNAATEGGDTITDFLGSDDQFRISASGFGGGLVAGGSLVDGSTFIAAADAAATTATGTFLYDTSTGVLSWDADGTGSGAAAQIATLTGIPTVKAIDFDIIA